MQKQDFSEEITAGFEALKTRGDIKMADIIDLHGASTLGAILLVLSIPALLPSTGIPIGTVMSLGMFAVAVSMMMGVDHVKLPRKLAEMKLSETSAEKLIRFLVKIYRFAEKFSHPRLEFMCSHKARQFLSLMVFLFAALIFLPIPFGNTAPAFALLILGAGILLKDGVIVIASLIAGILALIITYFIFAAGYMAVKTVF